MAEKSQQHQEIIKKIHDYYGFQTRKEAADFFGVSRQKYTGWYTHGTPWEFDIVYPKVKESINESWLKTGEGEMLKESATISTNKKQEKSGSKKKDKSKEKRGERFVAVLEYLKQKKGIRKDFEAAKYFGISAQLLNIWKDGRWPFEKVLGKVKDYIDPIWLYNGEGEMLIADQNLIIENYEKQIKELESKYKALSKENESLKKDIEEMKNVITAYKTIQNYNR